MISDSSKMTPSEPPADPGSVAETVRAIEALDAKRTGKYDELKEDSIIDRGFGFESDAAAQLRWYDDALAKSKRTAEDAAIDRAFGL